MMFEQDFQNDLFDNEPCQPVSVQNQLLLAKQKKFLSAMSNFEQEQLGQDEYIYKTFQKDQNNFLGSQKLQQQLRQPFKYQDEDDDEDNLEIQVDDNDNNNLNNDYEDQEIPNNIAEQQPYCMQNACMQLQDNLEAQQIYQDLQCVQEETPIQHFLRQIDQENDSEDEGIQDYKIGGYHPVHVGEVIQQRYVIIQKIGWGHFSTVWLAKDFKYDTYVALKIQKSAPHYLEAAYDEVEILQKVARMCQSKEWIDQLKQFHKNETKNIITKNDCQIVQLLNSFIYKGPYGNHFCFVFEILGVNLLEVIKRYNYQGVPMHLCRKIAKQVLIGLDFLHRFCQVIHTDLKPENVLLQLTQEEIKDIVENGQLTKNQLFADRLKVLRKLLGLTVVDDDLIQQVDPQRKMPLSQKNVQELQTQQNKETVQNIKQPVQQLSQPIQQQNVNNCSECTNNQNANTNTTNTTTTNVDSTSNQQQENKDDKKLTKNQKKNIKKRNQKKRRKQQQIQQDQESQSASQLILPQPQPQEAAKQAVMGQQLPQQPQTEHQSCTNNAGVHIDEQTINENLSTKDSKLDSPNITSTDNPEHEKAINVNDLFSQKDCKIFDKNKLMRGPKLNENFQLKIADLGNACWTSHHFATEIQTRQYRSPEVIINAKYNTTADIWSCACMIFEMLTGDFLFEPRKGPTFGKNDDHLAQIEELIGKFPKNYCLRGNHSKKYFDPSGSLKRIPTLHYWGLQNVLIEKYKMKPKEALSFAKFLLPMLHCQPEKRATALECLESEWLNMPPEENYKMSDEEYQTYLKNKIQDEDNVMAVNHDLVDSDLNDGDEEDNDSSDYEDDEQFYEHKPDIQRNLIDRSFTNLGYIGFGDGIDFDALDNTGNWQFENI